MDKRYRELARVVIDHSLEVHPGQSVLIRFDTAGARFAEVFAQEVLRVNAHPVFEFSSPRAAAVRIAEGSPEQLAFVHPSEVARTDCDCQVLIEAPTGLTLPEFEPERLATRTQALAEWRRRIEHVRYAIVLVPTLHLARSLGMEFEACEDFVFNVTVGVDWVRMARRAQKIKQVFDAGSLVRIEAPGTEISFSLAGRSGAAAAGQRNIPDGKVFFAPVVETVKGFITFHDTLWALGGPVRGLQLDFRDGRVVHVDAQEGLGRVRALLQTDSGANCIGEFGIGINPTIDRITGHVLLDEKAAGTVHFALGRSLPGTGGDVESAVHWAMVLDLRRGGQVLLDDQVVCRDGKWYLGRPAVGVATAGA
ncbi:MAG TPA: aminopeptidase [Symbiobacteriaceae bacterium]